MSVLRLRPRVYCPLRGFRVSGLVVRVQVERPRIMAHNAMYKNAITIISFLTGAAVLTYLCFFVQGSGLKVSRGLSNYLYYFGGSLV